MKRIFWLIAVLAIVAACGQRAAEAEVQEESQMEITFATVQFTIEGMTCDDCELTINSGLAELEGVAEVNSTWEEGIATVVYDPGLANIEDMQAAIRGKGYEVVGFNFIEEEVAEPEMEGAVEVVE